MNDSDCQTGTLVQALRIHVLSSHAGLGSAFLHAVFPTAVETDKVRVDIAGQPFELTIPGCSDGGVEAISSPDGVVLTARHLDGVSLKSLKAHLDGLAGSPAMPVAAALLRDEGDSEFKISCYSCGQKLWVREPDQGKRGRCPNCHKAFTLPSQESYFRTALQLSEAAPVRRATLGHAAGCEQVLSDLAALITAPAPFGAREPGDDASDPISRMPEVPKADTDVVAPIDDD